MSKKVLIAYGTRYGSTEEISIKFKETLETHGFNVDLLNLRSKNKQKLNLLDYSGLLVGSGIRIKRWTKEPKNFLKKHAKAINDNNILVGIFLSSGEASDPEERPTAVEEYLVKVLTNIGLRLGENVLYDAFGGLYSVPNTSNLNWFNRRMMKMVVTEVAKEEGIELDPEETIDLRDWDQITAFIERFITKIN